MEDAIAYRIGHLAALLEAAGLLGQQPGMIVAQAAEYPARWLGRALDALDLAPDGVLIRRYADALGPLPEELGDAAQSAVMLGYYHQRARLAGKPVRRPVPAL